MRVAVCLSPEANADERTALRLGRMLAGAEPLGLVTVIAPGAAVAALPEGLGPCQHVVVPCDIVDDTDFHTLGRILAAACRRLGADVVLAGARSPRRGLGATSAALAHHWGAPHLACAGWVARAGADRVSARVRAGGRIVSVGLATPAVISVLGAAEPAAGATLATADEFTPPPVGPPTQATVERVTPEELGLDPGVLRRRDDPRGALEAEAPRPCQAMTSAAALMDFLAGAAASR